MKTFAIIMCVSTTVSLGLLYWWVKKAPIEDDPFNYYDEYNSKNKRP